MDIKKTQVPAVPLTTATSTADKSAKSPSKQVTPEATTLPKVIDVVLSPEAALMSKLAATGESPFNADKVSKIKKSVEDGSFEVNTEAVADALIENAVALLKKQTAH